MSAEAELPDEPCEHQWTFHGEDGGIAYYECSLCREERLDDARLTWPAKDDLTAPPADRNFAERFGCLGVLIFCCCFWFVIFLIWKGWLA